MKKILTILMILFLMASSVFAVDSWDLVNHEVDDWGDAIVVGAATLDTVEDELLIEMKLMELDNSNPPKLVEVDGFILEAQAHIDSVVDIPNEKVDIDMIPINKNGLPKNGQFEYQYNYFDTPSVQLDTVLFEDLEEIFYVDDIAVDFEITVHVTMISTTDFGDAVEAYPDYVKVTKDAGLEALEFDEYLMKEFILLEGYEDSIVTGWINSELFNPDKNWSKYSKKDLAKQPE